MKKLIISLGFLTVGTLVMAQNNDPSYSIHNYKHPNKAKIAMEKIEESNSVAYISEADVQNRNYKAVTYNMQQSGAVVSTNDVEVNVNSVFSSQNYKSSFGSKKVEQNAAQNQFIPVACSKPNKRHNDFVKKSQNYKSQF